MAFQDEALNKLLEEELSAGNAVAEDTAWPPKYRRLIILNGRFTKPYRPGELGLTYRVLNDAHYWYAEYVSKSDQEVLACR